jgi:hypothetical protein
MTAMATPQLIEHMRVIGIRHLSTPSTPREIVIWSAATYPLPLVPHHSCLTLVNAVSSQRTLQVPVTF